MEHRALPIVPMIVSGEGECSLIDRNIRDVCDVNNAGGGRAGGNNGRAEGVDIGRAEANHENRVQNNSQNTCSGQKIEGRHINNIIRNAG